jgi:hypothetical protein
MRCPILPHVPSILKRLINVIHVQTNSNAIFFSNIQFNLSFNYFFYRDNVEAHASVLHRKLRHWLPLIYRESLVLSISQ